MQDKNALINCYKVLNVSTDIEWSELRKQYKKLAHKWHPDRYKEGSNEKQIANDKIKQLTVAYQQLENFYKKHGELPTFETPSPTRPAQKNTTPRSTTKPTTKKNGNKTRDTAIQKQSRFKHSVVAIIAATSIAILLQGLPHIENKQSNSRSHQEIETNASSENKPEIVNKFRKTKKTNATFSYGASIGEVISKQGTPDTVEGNTWFYGKSKITFINGRVANWTHDPDDPLNVHL